MKQLIALLFTLISIFNLAHGQQKQCSCTLDKFINDGTAHCETTLLKNGSKLYYQFNCDSVWLTLENKRGNNKVIYSLAGSDFKDLYGYNFRIGYQLMKEYNKYLLFRTGCPANGPCNFVVINKETGKKVKELGELIYDHSSDKFYDFVVYFSKSDKVNSIVLYYLDNNKKYSISIRSYHFTGLIPEYEFDSIKVKNNTLTLKYGEKTININLLKYHG